MSAAADRGGPFDRDGTESRNWMRASPPGIAFRFRAAESSPVGPRATPMPQPRIRHRGAIVWVAIVLATLALAAASGRLHGERADTSSRAMAVERAIPAPAATTPQDATTRLDPASIARLVVPDRNVNVALPKQTRRHERRSGPASPGNVVVTASRDANLRFLRRVEVGDEVIVESTHGEQFRYRVRDVRIAARDDVNATATPAEPTLTLITWYPFSVADSETALRYVVVATALTGTV
jgi:LPXTG-site transpeptidase (sortase) family protein